MGPKYAATVVFGMFVPEVSRASAPLRLIWHREGSGVPLRDHPAVTVERYGDDATCYYALQVASTVMRWCGGEVEPPRRIPECGPGWASEAELVAMVNAAAESLGIEGYETGWHFATDVW